MFQLNNSCENIAYCQASWVGTCPAGYTVGQNGVCTANIYGSWEGVWCGDLENCWGTAGDNCNGDTSSEYTCPTGASLTCNDVANYYYDDWNSGALWNYRTVTCNPQTTATVLTCPANYHSDGCGNCIADPICSSGAFDSNIGRCRIGSTYTPTCPAGFDPATNLCASAPTCSAGTYSNTTHTCVVTTTTTAAASCPVGTNLDPNVHQCVSTPTCISGSRYDTANNRCTLNFGNVTYAYNGTQPHAVTGTSDGVTYTYDANGNMTFDGIRNITYNYDNMPISVTLNGVTTSFVYDGNGNRVKKITPSGTTVYIGDLYTCREGTCVKHIFAGDTRIALKVSPTNISYYHQDHLSSTRVVTDINGNREGEVNYFPFGSTMSDTAGVSHMYTSQEFDAETGLYFYNARYYNPQLGRFISPDTIVSAPFNPQSLNRYSYVLNNPLIYTDPSGHDFWSSIVPEFHGGSDFWNRNRDGIEIGVVIVGTAVATWYCGGCGAMPYLEGALVGEAVGGSMAYVMGGNVLEGVVVGGALGALSAYTPTGADGSAGITTAGGDTGYGYIEVWSDVPKTLGQAQQQYNLEQAAKELLTDIKYASYAYGSYEVASYVASGLGAASGSSSGGETPASSGGGRSNGGAAGPRITGNFVQDTITGLDFFFGCVACDLAGPNLLDAVGPGASGYYTYLAWKHAATTPSKVFGTSALMYPAKSSIYRGYMTKAARAGVAGALIQVDYSLLNCLFDEWDYMNK